MTKNKSEQKRREKEYRGEVEERRGRKVVVMCKMWHTSDQVSHR